MKNWAVLGLIALMSVSAWADNHMSMHGFNAKLSGQISKEVVFRSEEDNAGTADYVGIQDPNTFGTWLGATVDYDLGNNNKVAGTLEIGAESNNGNGTFVRRAVIDFTGNYGSIKGGLDSTNAAEYLWSIDPFNHTNFRSGGNAMGFVDKNFNSNGGTTNSGVQGLGFNTREFQEHLAYETPMIGEFFKLSAEIGRSGNDGVTAENTNANVTSYTVNAVVDKDLANDMKFGALVSYTQADEGFTPSDETPTALQLAANIGGKNWKIAAGYGMLSTDTPDGEVTKIFVSGEYSFNEKVRAALSYASAMVDTNGFSTATADANFSNINAGVFYDIHKNVEVRGAVAYGTIEKAFGTTDNDYTAVLAGATVRL